MKNCVCVYVCMFNSTRLVLSFICPFAYDSGFNQELVFLCRVNVGFADVVIHSCLVPLWDRVRVITRVILKEVSAKKRVGTLTIITLDQQVNQGTDFGKLASVITIILTSS